MSRNKDMSLAGALFWLALGISIIVGWGMNIYQLVTSHDNGLTAKFVLKVVGIFVVPLGSLLGFIN